MKKFLISLLIFILPCNSNFCFASDDFDYGIEKTEVNFSDNFTINDNTTGIVETKSTVADFVPLFKRSVIVPIKENVSALIRACCEMRSKSYDSTAVSVSYTHLTLPTTSRV